MTVDPGVKRLLFGIELTLFAIVLGILQANREVSILVALGGLVVALSGLGQPAGASDAEGLPDVPSA